MTHNYTGGSERWQVNGGPRMLTGRCEEMVCQWPARPPLLFDREEKLRLLALSKPSVLIQPATHFSHASDGIC